MITEDTLLKTLTQNLPKAGGPLRLGIGDDASIIRIGKKDILITVDSLVEEVHFRRNWAPWKVWGEKLALSTLSDIAAMGGTPKYAWIVLCLPKKITTATLQKFYQGLDRIFKKEKVLLAGGNITRSPKGFAAHLTLWGECQAGKAMLRSQAKAGDLVFVSGFLEKDFLHSKAELKLGRWLNRRGCRAAMDVSDGLLKDLDRFAKASKVQITIDASKIPYRGPSLKEALTCGENYSLVFTMPPSWKPKNPPTRLRTIGVVKKGPPGVLVRGKNGELLKFHKLGYDVASRQ